MPAPRRRVRDSTSSRSGCRRWSQALADSRERPSPCATPARAARSDRGRPAWWAPSRLGPPWCNRRRHTSARSVEVPPGDRRLARPGGGLPADAVCRRSAFGDHHPVGTRRPQRTTAPDCGDRTESLGRRAARVVASIAVAMRSSGGRESTLVAERDPWWTAPPVSLSIWVRAPPAAAGSIRRQPQMSRSRSSRSAPSASTRLMDLRRSASSPRCACVPSVPSRWPIPPGATSPLAAYRGFLAR